MAVAAGLALLLGAAGAVAALRSGVLHREESAATAAPRPRPLPARRIAAVESPPAVALPAKSVSRPEHPERPATAQESYAAELGLLQKAHLAYANGTYSAALVLVAEHARRFPNGRLAEEREALRVRSLASAGRADAARRAVAAFAARFPRSVLLPRLQQSVSGAP
jgi:hypothetical protein